MSHISYAAPAWGAAFLALVAFGLTWVWLPESHHQATAARPAPWREMPGLLTRPVLGRLLVIDFLYWASFAVYQTTFALFGKIRFGFDVAETGYVLTFAGIIGVVVQLRLVGPMVRRYGEKATLIAGLVLAAAGLAGAAMTRTVPLFVATLVPAGIGAALSSPALIALLSQTTHSSEQGRVQGVSGALEGLGRTVGPVWGNGLLQLAGEGVAYLSAAGLLFVTAVLAGRVETEPGAPAEARAPRSEATRCAGGQADETTPP